MKQNVSNPNEQSKKNLPQHQEIPKLPRLIFVAHPKSSGLWDVKGKHEHFTTGQNGATLFHKELLQQPCQFRFRLEKGFLTIGLAPSSLVGGNLAGQTRIFYNFTYGTIINQFQERSGFPKAQTGHMFKIEHPDVITMQANHNIVTWFLNKKKVGWHEITKELLSQKPVAVVFCDGTFSQV